MLTVHDIVSAPPSRIWSPWSLAQFAAPLVRAGQRSPFLDPAFCADAIERESRRRGAHGYVGGYLEDRAILWQGSYLEPARAVHLGVDISSDVGVPVLAPHGGVVHSAWHDPDQNGGWGGRVILAQPGGGFTILAHLDLAPDLSSAPMVGAGARLGTVAPPDRNGGWFPHVHLQLAASVNELVDLDGYGPADARNALRFPDPLVGLGILLSA